MILWMLHFGAMAVTAFWLSWCALIPVDFGFRAGYWLLDIDEHIQTFAPQNAFRQGYETTSHEERMSHFSAIVRAINTGGEGLTEITYDNGGSTRPTLLREPEVLHLQDVSALVSAFHTWGKLMSLVWVTTFWLAMRLGWSIPSSWKTLKTALIMSGTCSLVLLWAGPTRVFYWLHTHLFPEDHQWFFYYQESLMTTLMKAPDVFGFIAILWAIAGLSGILLFILVERVILAKSDWLTKTHPLMANRQNLSAKESGFSDAKTKSAKQGNTSDRKTRQPKEGN